MHTLYLDDSGSVQNRSDRHIILAGLSLFERQNYWLTLALDRLAERTWPDNPRGLEFHGTEIWNGKKQWRGLERDVRDDVMCQALGLIARTPSVRLFGAAIHRRAVEQEDPLEFAFEHLAHRFDRMLARLHHSGDTQRGLIVLDESAYETSLQSLSLTYRQRGHRWGRLVNLAEAPLFINSKATRLIQAADLVAYALRKYYEQGNAHYFDIIKHAFDAQAGVVHGLIHAVPSGEVCPCHVCRRE